MKTTTAATPTVSTPHQASPFFARSADKDHLAMKQTPESPFFAPAGIQAKLTVGQPDDPYEREADTMAEKVVQKFGETQSVGQTIQRKCEACGNGEKLQKMGAAGEAPAGLEAKLNASAGSGSPLPETVKGGMESGFGADFSAVRVHTGSEAVQMSRQLNAQAFTHGSNIYFNEGKFSPGSKDGKTLLAHELTHTIQQKGMVQKKIQKQSIRNPLFPCRETSLLPGGSDFFGTWVHMMIQQRYVSTIDAMAATEYTIPGSGATGGTGRADIIASNGGVYEIKPAGLAVDGLKEALGYVAFASKVCDPTVNWHLGRVYFPYSFTLGDQFVFSWLINPGVIVYTRRRIPTVPVPVPKTVTDHIKDFVKKVVNDGVDATKAAEELLGKNPELAWTILGLGLVGIIALLADDASGVGVADDVAIPPIAILMRVALRYAF